MTTNRFQGLSPEELTTLMLGLSSYKIPEDDPGYKDRNRRRIGLMTEVSKVLSEKVRF